MHIVGDATKENHTRKGEIVLDGLEVAHFRKAGRFSLSGFLGIPFPFLLHFLFFFFWFFFHHIFLCVCLCVFLSVFFGTKSIFSEFVKLLGQTMESLQK